jgi:DNA-binding GntR family transcriptional regulator
MISTEEKILAQRLCEQQSVDVYDLHKELKLSPSQLFKALHNLRALGIIRVRGLIASRSKNFFAALFHFRHLIFNHDRPWKRLEQTLPPVDQS